MESEPVFNAPLHAQTAWIMHPLLAPLAQLLILLPAMPACFAKAHAKLVNLATLPLV